VLIEIVCLFRADDQGDRVAPERIRGPAHAIAKYMEDKHVATSGSIACRYSPRQDLRQGLFFVQGGKIIADLQAPCSLQQIIKNVSWFCAPVRCQLYIIDSWNHLDR
jgi:hypothetical protein